MSKERESELSKIAPQLERLEHELKAVVAELGKLKQQTVTTGQLSRSESAGFDLFRIAKSKEVVDIAPNTLRAYFDEGLPFYKKGKCIFVSKTELAAFIRSSSV